MFQKNGEYSELFEFFFRNEWKNDEIFKNRKNGNGLDYMGDDYDHSIEISIKREGAANKRDYSYYVNFIASYSSWYSINQKNGITLIFHSM